MTANLADEVGVDMLVLLPAQKALAIADRWLTIAFQRC